MTHRLVRFSKRDGNSKESSKNGEIIFEQNNFDGFLEYIFENGFDNYVYDIQYQQGRDERIYKSISIGNYERDEYKTEKNQILADKMRQLINVLNLDING